MKAKMLTFILVLMLGGFTLMRVGADQATVQVTPESYTVPDVGLTFVVNVTIQNVENLYGWEFKLYYSQDILNGTSIVEGPFLKTGGIPTFFLMANFTDNYNATHGFLSLLCLRTAGDAPGVNGSGTLATITFKSTSTDGPRLLHLEEAQLSDPNATEIPCATVDGEVTILPEFSPALVLPLLAMLVLAAICLKKRLLNHRGIFHSP